MAREGVAFSLVTLAGFLASLALWLIGGNIFFIVSAVLFIILTTFLFLFFRNPERLIPEDADIIVSPADGKIVEIADFDDKRFHGAKQKIGIFLSIWDVHINRCPVDGFITNVEYKRGRFKPAFLYSASEDNERTKIAVETTNGIMFLRQIAGILARRIICRLKPGDRITRGERFGMIILGSRVEVYLPENVEVYVEKGDRVKGGESIIGKFISDG